VREVGRRTLNMRHFDVQLIGGAVLHEGRSPRWQRAKGRRWCNVACLSQRLTGEGVHVVTVTTTWPQGR